MEHILKLEQVKKYYGGAAGNITKAVDYYTIVKISFQCHFFEYFVSISDLLLSKL